MRCRNGLDSDVAAVMSRFKQRWSGSCTAPGSKVYIIRWSNGVNSVFLLVGWLVLITWRFQLLQKIQSLQWSEADFWKLSWSSAWQWKLVGLMYWCRKLCMSSKPCIRPRPVGTSSPQNRQKRARRMLVVGTGGFAQYIWKNLFLHVSNRFAPLQKKRWFGILKEQ